MNRHEQQSVAMEAKRWVVRLDELSSLERAELDRWLEESESHRAEFEVAKAKWRSLAFLEGHKVQLADGLGTANANRQPNGMRQYWRPLAAAAAIAAAAVVIGWLLLPQDYRNEYYTAVGQQLEVELPDGSEVLLNTRTRLNVRFTRDARTVFLEHGEAHFEVSHDSRRPFVVVAGAAVVRAVGTAFTVSVIEEAMEVTVTDGEVEIAQRPAPAAPVSLSSVKPLQRLAKAQTARMSHDDIGAVAVVEPELIERKLAWHYGMLEFVNAPLSEVIADAGRYTDKVLEIEDPELRDYRVTIIAKTSNIDGLLQNLGNSTDAFSVSHISSSHVVISSAKPQAASAD